MLNFELRSYLRAAFLVSTVVWSSLNFASTESGSTCPILLARSARVQFELVDLGKVIAATRTHFDEIEDANGLNTFQFIWAIARLGDEGGWAGVNEVRAASGLAYHTSHSRTGTLVIRTLRANGYIDSKDDPKDARRKLIRLTAKAQDLLSAFLVRLSGDGIKFIWPATDAT